MGKLKKLLQTAKLATGIGSIKKPPDWPVNGFEEELKNLQGGFKESLMGAARGQDNKAMALWLNSKVVNARDQQILQYLRSKGITL